MIRFRMSIQVTFKIPTDIYGKLSGTRNGKSEVLDEQLSLRVVEQGDLATIDKIF